MSGGKCQESFFDEIWSQNVYLGATAGSDHDVWVIGRGFTQRACNLPLSANDI